MIFCESENGGGWKKLPCYGVRGSRKPRRLGKFRPAGLGGEKRKQTYIGLERQVNLLAQQKRHAENAGSKQHERSRLRRGAASTTAVG